MTVFFVILRTIFKLEKSSPLLLKFINKRTPPAVCLAKHADLFSGCTFLEFQAGRWLVLQKDICGFGQFVQARHGMLHRPCNLNSFEFTFHVY